MAKNTMSLAPVNKGTTGLHLQAFHLCVFPVSPQEILLPPRFRALSHLQAFRLIVIPPSPSHHLLETRRGNKALPPLYCRCMSHVSEPQLWQICVLRGDPYGTIRTHRQADVPELCFGWRTSLLRTPRQMRYNIQKAEPMSYYVQRARRSPPLRTAKRIPGESPKLLDTTHIRTTPSCHWRWRDALVKGSMVAP
jgi:hypothetical protein